MPRVFRITTAQCSPLTCYLSAMLLAVSHPIVVLPNVITQSLRVHHSLTYVSLDVSLEKKRPNAELSENPKRVWLRNMPALVSRGLL